MGLAPPPALHTWSNRILARGASILVLLVTAIGAGPSTPLGWGGREYREARGLFEQIWRPGTASPNGGDGVGPLYNDRSCIGCHHLGGTGGAGDNASNATVLAAIPGTSIVGRDQLPSTFQGELEDLHPGFRGQTSIILHKHATSGPDEASLAALRNVAFVQTRANLVTLIRSERSTPALFGAGRIDAITDEDLLRAESHTFRGFPEITGRVSRLPDGRLGKFGWKGQTASLEEFVRGACATELGLEVPGHHQQSLHDAGDSGATPPALDLSEEDCQQMIQFVAKLPRPAVRSLKGSEWGARVFRSIGCAACHTPNLGKVSGLYSDLLLHDLGDRFLSVSSGYYGSASKATVVDRPASSPGQTVSPGEAGPTEWRTTPLWGVASSAPYLHDGRAPTLHDAITLHGGEAEATTKRYTALPTTDRRALLAFLNSQVAPSQPGSSTNAVTRSVASTRR